MNMRINKSNKCNSGREIGFLISNHDDIGAKICSEMGSTIWDRPFCWIPGCSFFFWGGGRVERTVYESLKKQLKGWCPPRAERRRPLANHCNQGWRRAGRPTRRA